MHTVDVNGKQHSVKFKNLVVCTEKDASIPLGYWAQAAQSMAIVIALHLVFGAAVVCVKLQFPALFGTETDDSMEREENPLAMMLNPSLPSPFVASLCSMTVGYSVFILWGAIICLSWMHRPL